MRTTLDLPDELFRQVKAKAATEGISLKELVTDYVVCGLKGASKLERSRKPRSPLPVLKRRGRAVIPNLTPTLQAQFEEEEDLAKLRRSFRR